MSKALTEAKALFLQLHRLCADGCSESAEADQIRDDLDVIWYGLTPEEGEQLNAYAAELKQKP